MLHQHTDSICTSICRDHDGKVTPEEVAAAAAYLKDTIGKEGVQEFISNLSKDKGPCTHDFPVVLMVALHCLLTTFYAAEGKILVEDIVKLASQTDENNEDQEESRQ